MPRRLAPMLLSAVLFTGVAVLAWRKLRFWQGQALAAGVILVVVYLAWILWELGVSWRDAKVESVRMDRGTAEAYAIAQGTTALSALWFESVWPTLPTLFVWVGAITFIGGVALRRSAVRELGAFYSHRVQLLERHRVVQTGPYTWLRHPAYAGMLLAHLGWVLCFFNWLSVGVLCFGLLPAICLRIRVEENALAGAPGYRDFCETRSRLVPKVW